MGAKQKKDTMSASEAKNNFGELLECARKKPVKIERNGRPVAVVISNEEFERLEALEDEWWARQADEALKEGTLGAEDSEKFLAEMMNAKN
ncbi:MAG: prevent-host-death protein [Bdellovibrionales bacterium CG10_big_fil_rev_8_21_14_0_10_45_34]|nr:MAG: prevent-host-death protein [Bdellovibrionales bacterium CG10_big_fil_rev_8_21_14_0_10_45_34]